MKRLHYAAAVIGTTAALALATFQLVPGMGVAHPPVEQAQTIEANLDVPVPVSAILAKACRNCHSHETVIPWYGRVAPASWLMANDVNKARRAMNLSAWSSGPGRSPGQAAATLAAACADIRSGRMPLAPYRFMHPESRLSQAEVQTFCNWANQSSRELLSRAARTRPTAAAADRP